MMAIIVAKIDAGVCAVDLDEVCIHTRTHLQTRARTRAHPAENTSGLALVHVTLHCFLRALCSCTAQYMRSCS